MNNEVSKFDSHIDHTDKQYCAHKDGMVFSRYFTGHIYSLLEHDENPEIDETNVACVDGMGQADIVMSNTHKSTVKKVGVHSNFTRDSPVLNSVVSPVLESRHKTISASSENQNPNSNVNVSVNSKFNLSLISRPQNRSRINNAKHTDIFQSWDAQNPQKFGFIPISDLILPNKDKHIPLQGNLLDARYAIARKGKHNFMGAQIEIPSQLNLDVWQS